MSDRAHFDVASAKDYTGQFDLVCFFDCLHDMGDPVGPAQHARECLLPGGTVMLVEPFAFDSRPQNIAENPMAALFYLASSCICTPNSLSQDVGLALGHRPVRQGSVRCSRKPDSATSGALLRRR